MNPFPGLRPFQPGEAHLFFGREHQVGSMVAKLERTHFLTIVGTSGCGKSSLVNCGLLPALHRGDLDATPSAWRVASFRPGNDPIGAMSRALAAEGVLYSNAPAGVFSLEEIVESTLRMSRLGLIDAWEQAHRPPDEKLLVVVDQFEELFRFHAIGAVAGAKSHELGDEATAFVNLLLEVRSRRPATIYVVLTMRSDFLGDTAQLAGLPEAINDGQYLVPRMTRDERKRAIEGPVREVGESMSPVLLTRLVNDVGDNADQLSILQHALNRTWAEWEKTGTGPLDLAHYAEIGTMALALDQHAEKAYGELATDEDRKICEKLFKALTDKASDSRGIRRPTTVETLCALTGSSLEDLDERVTAVFRTPSRSFLMPPESESLRPTSVIDISHESLMRVWKRLRAWSDEEAQAALAYRRLAETARLQAEDKADLWRGRDLEGALLWRDTIHPTQLWAERYAPGFATAMEFLDKCVAARDAEAEERAEARRQARQAEQEKEQARQRTRKLMIVAGTAVAASLAFALYVYSFMRIREAETLETRAGKAIASAESREKYAKAVEATVENQLTGDLFEGAQQALQKYSVEPTTSLDRAEVAHRFAASTRVTALAASTPAAERAGVTVEYFRKPTDTVDLGAALTQLGFRVEPKRMRNPNVTNAIWYGSQVPESSVKLVAYALIRAGYDVVGIQPQRDESVKTMVIQVGRNVGLELDPPFTPEVIEATPIPQLRRVEMDVRGNLEGVVLQVDAGGRKGEIYALGRRVAFELAPNTPPLAEGQWVRYTLFLRGNQRYVRGVTVIPEPPAAKLGRALD